MRKKIGIFTWCNRGVNYGQTLQAFAMYRIMCKMGCQAKLIQYRKRIEEEPVNHDLGNPYANSIYEFFWGLYRAGSDFWKEKIKFNIFTKRYIKKLKIVMRLFVEVIRFGIPLLLIQYIS